MTTFVDDGYFCASGVESEHKMHKIMNYYVKTHEAIGDKIQK